MEKNENIWILTKLREECEKVHLDSEAKALAAAVYSMGIVEEMKQQRDAALAMIERYSTWNRTYSNMVEDAISRQAAIDALCDNCDNVQAVCPHYPCKQYTTIEALPEQVRKFVGLDVMYPDPELCTYKEYTGKPYYSIKYIENGEIYVGYGTYNPEVLSRYLREYFMPSAQPEAYDSQKEVAKYVTAFSDGYDRGKADAQPEIIRCKDCKHRPVANYDWQDGFDIEFPDHRCPCQCDDNYYNWLPDDNWFCGNAERRTDG